MTKVKFIITLHSIVILILVTSGLFGCNRLPKTDKLKKEENEWTEVTIDAEIKKDVVYKELDKQKELFSVLEKQDSLMKRTSDVAYYYDSRKKDDYYAKFNNCRAAMLESDTLAIDIGFGNGFGGQGFAIAYFNKKFHAQPYFSDDIVYEGEVEPSFKVIYQKLTLDKTDYNIGDSLFGWIDFKSVETAPNNGREHFGVGHFRTKVQKPGWEP